VSISNEPIRTGRDHAVELRAPGPPDLLMNGSDRKVISVIIIFLNADRFLEESIRSVVSQTYNSWELLLVDDGSTDRSAEIATGFAAQSPDRIRYFHHPGRENRGMSASRNLGIHEARGEYIALLDADDVYLSEKLEQQLRLIEEHPAAGMVYGSTEYWFSWTGDARDEGRDRVRRHNLPTDTLFRPPELFRRFVSGRARTPCTCGVLLRTQVVREVGGFEERFWGIDEDQAFFSKIALHTPVFVDAGCWDRYRQHPHSAVHRSRRSGEWQPGRRPTPARERYVDWLAEYLEKLEITDPALWREVRRQGRPQRFPRLYRFLAAVDDVVQGPRRAVRSRMHGIRRWLTSVLPAGGQTAEAFPPLSNSATSHREDEE